MNLLTWPTRTMRAIRAQSADNSGTPALHIYARTSGGLVTQRVHLSGKDVHLTGHRYALPETRYAVPPSIDAHLTPNCGQLMATEATP